MLFQWAFQLIQRVLLLLPVVTYYCGCLPCLGVLFYLVGAGTTVRVLRRREGFTLSLARFPWPVSVPNGCWHPVHYSWVFKSLDFVLDITVLQPNPLFSRCTHWQFVGGLTVLGYRGLVVYGRPLFFLSALVCCNRTPSKPSANTRWWQATCANLEPLRILPFFLFSVLRYV